MLARRTARKQVGKDPQALERAFDRRLQAVSADHCSFCRSHRGLGLLRGAEAGLDPLQRVRHPLRGLPSRWGISLPTSSLPPADGSGPKKISDLYREKPLVLVFGSYT